MMHDKADDGFYSYAGESNGPVIITPVCMALEAQSLTRSAADGPVLQISKNEQTCLPLTSLTFLNIPFI